MLRRLFLLVLTVLWTSVSFAQEGREVAGVVRDSAGTGIMGATIRLVPLNSSDTLQTRTNYDGAFLFRDIKATQFSISISILGYYPAHIRSVNAIGNTRFDLPAPVVLRASSILLNQVVVDGTPQVVIKQDTIEYNAADYKLKENAVAEDLLKRLDGVEVDRSGNVSAQGKTVSKVRVNGKDFFGGDVKTATKNIPAKAIDKVQVVDDYGDQANFTGVRDGDPETIINITTRPGMGKGLIANATGGAGSDERYQLSGFATHINGDRNFGVTANLNNNGAQIGGLGFGGRGGPSGVTMVNASGGSGNFGAGPNAGEAGGGGGITTLGSVGLNYSNKWSPKLQVTAGYFFSSSDNSTLSSTFSQNATSLGTIFGTTASDRGANTFSHNLNSRIQYTITPNDMLIISPSVGFTNSRNVQFRNNLQTGVIRQDQITNSDSRMYTPSIGGNILYTHKFKKAGRNYSLNVGARSNEVDSDSDNLDNIRYYDPATSTLDRDSINQRINMINNLTFLTAFRFIYSEPLSTSSSLQFSYNANSNYYDNKRITNFSSPSGSLVQVDSLSNIFDYSFTSHQLGVNYNYRKQANELAIGITANPILLAGSSASLNTDIRRTNFYLAPILRYTHRYSRTRNVQVNYTSRASEPTFAQLQPVRDVSDPQRSIVGNPNLNSSFSHSLNANYNTSNPDARTSFLLRFQGSLTDDRIVANTVLIPDAYGSFKREIRYVNADGTYSYSGNYSWQKSFADKQYTIRLMGNAGYNNNVSFADNIRNFARETSVRQGLGLQINPGTWLEFSPNFSYRFAAINYTLPTTSDVRLHTYSVDVDGNVFFLKNRSLIWRFNGFKSFNNGYSGGLNVNPLVLNTSLEKAFLKDRTATLRLQAFDVFNQSNNINRYLTDNGFLDVSTNRLTRYFMLTLTMRLNRFAGGTRGPGPGRGSDGPGRSPGQ